MKRMTLYFLVVGLLTACNAGHRPLPPVKAVSSFGSTGSDRDNTDDRYDTSDPSYPNEPSDPIDLDDLGESGSGWDFADARANVFEPKCASCHEGENAAKDLNLTDYASALTRIIPGDSDASPLIKELRAGTMPKGGPVLDAELINKLADWIDEGAPEVVNIATPTPTPPISSEIKKTVNDCSPQSQAPEKLFRVSLHEYQQIVSDLFGMPLSPGHFARWTPIAEAHGFDTMSEARINQLGLEEQMATVAKLAEKGVKTATVRKLCGNKKTWGGCGKPVINYIASRGFRRPLRAEELEDFKDLFAKSFKEAKKRNQKNPHIEALETILQATLLSPNFMFRVEYVPGVLEPHQQSFATASKMAAYFGSTFPDATLWSLAQSQSLTTDQMAAQANRLMNQYAGRFARNFGGQWLDYRDSLYSSSGLGLSMALESEHVFANVLANNMRPEKLLKPGFTIVDQALANHYGLPFSAGPGFHAVATQDRGGILSQGHFLTSTSTGSELSRPIHRGLFTLQRVMCRTLPDLDQATLEEINQSRETIDPNLPLSQQSAQHRQSGSRCIQCHGQIDPIGLALENFDKNGIWRTAYSNGGAISNDFALEGNKLRNPNELASYLENSSEFKTCASTKLLTYAMNRPPGEGSTCAAESLLHLPDGSPASLKQMTLQAFLRTTPAPVVASAPTKVGPIKVIPKKSPTKKKAATKANAKPKKTMTKSGSKPKRKVAARPVKKPTAKKTATKGGAKKNRSPASKAAGKKKK